MRCLAADSNGDNVRVPFGVDSIFVHAKISRCVAETQIAPEPISTRTHIGAIHAAISVPKRKLWIVSRRVVYES